jgi:hypothetical protein
MQDSLIIVWYEMKVAVAQNIQCQITDEKWCGNSLGV